jgi:hypothetical protein
MVIADTFREICGCDRRLFHSLSGTATVDDIIVPTGRGAYVTSVVPAWWHNVTTLVTQRDKITTQGRAVLSITLIVVDIFGNIQPPKRSKYDQRRAWTGAKAGVWFGWHKHKTTIEFADYFKLTDVELRHCSVTKRLNFKTDKQLVWRFILRKEIGIYFQLFVLL